MSRLYVLQKWNEYRQTLREDLTTQTLAETRDGFYAGVIAALSVMASTKGAAKQDLDAELYDYVRLLQEKLEELEREHGKNPS
jgi:hypothetical protein